MKQGNIIKPKVCQKCGLDKKLESHHEDYTKAKEVWWVCRQCHFNYFHPGKLMKGEKIIQVEVSVI